ncbi:MAG: hypothetical protein LBF86_03785 [Helicobacteraceae bacterium]|nr:hypothetical protein [Helicobacteraceae bacterium]
MKRLSTYKTPLILFLFLSILWIANNIYHVLPLKIYYYFVNGQTITLERYKVNLPFPQWVYVGKNELLFVISSDKNNFAEIAIDYRNVDIDHLLTTCDQIQKEQKTYKNISGTEYLCYQADIGVTLYFLSSDNFFFLRTANYQNDTLLYKMLFDSITVAEYKDTTTDHNLTSNNNSKISNKQASYVQKPL